MSLSSTGDYQAFLNIFMWWIEERFGVSFGNYNQDGTVQVSPWAFELIRYGYAPQDTSNYGPSIGYDHPNIPVGYPEALSTAEGLDEADILTIVTAYLAYRHTRQGSDTNNAAATIFRAY